MRITALSDTHNQHFNRRIITRNRVITSDVLVHAGDFTVNGNPGEVHAFADWIRDQAAYFKYVVFVAGNHDLTMHYHNTIGRSYFKDIPNVYYLENSSVTLDGIKFYGSPNTIDYITIDGISRQKKGQWAFGTRREDMYKIWDLIPSDIDVLITHSPPLNVGDEHDGMHLGCPSLLEKVQEVKPKAHIFGHIHSGAGQYENTSTQFINAAILDDDYLIKNQPTLIEI